MRSNSDSVISYWDLGLTEHAPSSEKKIFKAKYSFFQPLRLSVVFLYQQKFVEFINSSCLSVCMNIRQNLSQKFYLNIKSSNFLNPFPYRQNSIASNKHAQQTQSYYCKISRQMELASQGPSQSWNIAVAHQTGHTAKKVSRVMLQFFWFTPIFHSSARNTVAKIRAKSGKNVSNKVIAQSTQFLKYLSLSKLSLCALGLLAALCWMRRKLETGIVIRLVSFQ